MVSGRALAALVLGVSLVKVLIKRAFGAVTGLRLFKENYGPDRLPAVAPGEREAMMKFSGCIACGRCDLGEGERMRASRGAYPGMMAFVLASSRSMPDFDAAERALGFVDDDVLAQKEAICPADVPFRALARFVRAKAAEVKADYKPAVTEGVKPA
ncbi:MAG: hypothetical protein HOV80_24140 [Polyangiaceae bacterium]|nr:hypothetical protein [Polyangiaceae bacterium]